VRLSIFSEDFVELQAQSELSN